MNLKDKAVEMTKADMKARLDDITGNLKDTDQVIPLYVFKEVFLPYFDIRVDMEQAAREKLFDMWVSMVATTISSPVRVVDDTDPDITLIRVPPLMDTAGVSINQKNMSMLERSMKIHSMKKDGLPEVADSELNYSLANVAVEYKDTVGEKWLEFYEYFDLPVAVIGDEYLSLEELKERKGITDEKEQKQDEDDTLLDDLFG